MAVRSANVSIVARKLVRGANGHRLRRSRIPPVCATGSASAESLVPVALRTLAKPVARETRLAAASRFCHIPNSHPMTITRFTSNSLPRLLQSVRHVVAAIACGQGM